MAAIGGIERTQRPAAAGVTALPLLQKLLVAGCLWATGGEVDHDAVTSVRDQGSSRSTWVRCYLWPT